MSAYSTHSTDSGATPRGRYHQRRRYEFGSSGVVYILVTVLLALGAFNSQNNLLFWAFGFSLAILIVSGLLSGAMLMRLEVERLTPADVPLREPAVFRYRVTNHAARFLPAFALTLQERTLPEPKARRLVALRTRLGQVTANQSRARAPVESPRAFIAHLAPRAIVTVQATCRTLHRGEVRLSGIELSTGFPFGLVCKYLEFDQPGSVIVTPEVIAADISALAQAAATSHTAPAANRPGGGDEFFALREYAPGDDLRLLAWRASARRGVPMMRQNGAHAPVRVWVVLHLRVTPNDDAGDERTISRAAGVLASALGQRIDVGLCVPLVGLVIPPRGGRAHHAALLRALATLDLGPSDARGERVPTPREVRSSRSAIVVEVGRDEAGTQATLRGRANAQVASQPSDARTRSAPRAAARHP